MLQIPFFRDYYNLMSPVMILVLGLVFACLGVFKYHSKHVEALTNFTTSTENKSKKAIKTQNKMWSNKSLAERVLLGEKAILKEYESIRTKFERRRSSLFGL